MAVHQSKQLDKTALPGNENKKGDPVHPEPPFEEVYKTMVWRKEGKPKPSVPWS
jgi:hypothetical protein